MPKKKNDNSLITLLVVGVVLFIILLIAVAYVVITIFKSLIWHQFITCNWYGTAVYAAAWPTLVIDGYFPRTFGEKSPCNSPFPFSRNNYFFHLVISLTFTNLPSFSFPLTIFFDS